MNKYITENLFEFWAIVGKSIGTLINENDYKAVIVRESDWPNRIFDVNTKEMDFEYIIKLSQNNILPDKITLEKPTILAEDSRVKLFLEQGNMALDMNKYSLRIAEVNNIKQVQSVEDARVFAEIASKSFGYKVDHTIIQKLCIVESPIKLFIHWESNQCLGCGIIFIDSNHNAGLHMIGTIPEGRGKGIGTQMVMRLLEEIKAKSCNFCVLNASKMGEPIYKKLGFQSYGNLETYRILKSE